MILVNWNVIIDKVYQKYIKNYEYIRDYAI